VINEPEGDWIYAVDGKRIGPTSAEKIAMLISADGLPAGPDSLNQPGGPLVQ
jgi:hypothetical protein